ncbi:MAG: hypothetical protein Kow0059_17480 [Candidatus Sumerlaeia bacterium]
MPPARLNKNHLPPHKRLDRVMPLEMEQTFWARGLMRVAGVDEAGRGCLAGPVVAAAVVFPPGRAVPGVFDSKALRPEQRAEVFERIRAEAEAVGIGQAGAEEVDLINVHRAALLAAERALKNLGAVPDVVITDYLRVTPPDGCRQVLAPAHGDRLCHAVAAASIVAKVVRDRLMHDYESEYPGYGLANHKGYGTPAHLAALAEKGASSLHRMSFHGVPMFGRVVRSRSFSEIRARLDQAGSAVDVSAVMALIAGRREWLPQVELAELTAAALERLESLQSGENHVAGEQTFSDRMGGKLA